MSRRAHILRVNHGTETPTQAIWFDTETDQIPIDEHGVEHRLRFGYAAYRRRLKGGVWSAPEWLRFEDTDTFWGWVNDKVRPRSRCDLYCHNTSFDLPVMQTFSALPAMGWSLTRAIIDAPPTILTYRESSRTLRVLDTLNIWRMPLAALAKTIGLEKLPMPELTDTAEAWDTYAKQDVHIIMEACLRWWDLLVREDMGGFAPTLAGQSMRIFRHKYMDHTVYLDADTDALALSRSAYVGGRVECFRLGEITEPMALFDINSMYPHVMAAEEYPTKLIGYSARTRHLNLERQLHDRALCADVTLSTREPAYPVKHEDKLVFPVGTFRAKLSSPELRHALEHGHIVKVHAVAAYERAPLFQRFVRDLYQRRLDAAARGDHETAWQLKILMNSLYGKFGQRGIVWEAERDTNEWTAKTWIEVRYETGVRTHYRQFGGLVQQRIENDESRDSHPAIAAHVTAYARMYLWRMICHAGRENVYYCDTDSILVNAIGAERLQHFVDPVELGKLKCEGTFESAQLLGAKDYRMGSKERHKGVRASATWVDAHTIVQDKWSSLKGLLRLGTLGAPTTTRVTKHLSRRYTKGTVGDGGIVSPLSFNDRSGCE